MEVPEKYAKPMVRMIKQFNSKPLTVAQKDLSRKYGIDPDSPRFKEILATTTKIDDISKIMSPYGAAVVAVAIAIVIVLWSEPLGRLSIDPVEREALRYAAKQIQSNPEKIMELTGVKFTDEHLNLMGDP
ncbi:MAG: hypothetical protein A4E51_01889 [Methanosaeta sp. PtaU1.Bin055]|nr:MAG: hypothetical protein A4E51_01889 [Methanosaeta sp. PtaU1.Bin055]